MAKNCAPKAYNRAFAFSLNSRLCTTNDHFPQTNACCVREFLRLTSESDSNAKSTTESSRIFHNISFGRMAIYLLGCDQNILYSRYASTSLESLTKYSWNVYRLQINKHRRIYESHSKPNGIKYR